MDVGRWESLLIYKYKYVGDERSEVLVLVKWRESRLDWHGFDFGCVKKFHIFFHVEGEYDIERHYTFGCVYVTMYSGAFWYDWKSFVCHFTFLNQFLSLCLFSLASFFYGLLVFIWIRLMVEKLTFYLNHESLWTDGNQPICFLGLDILFRSFTPNT